MKGGVELKEECRNANANIPASALAQTLMCNRTAMMTVPVHLYPLRSVRWLRWLAR
jgi:hypothetical protein|tara:strand:- start:10039 stop:10206 length:168 start_codon:yes stop_codon:yes gene_type:complete